MPLLDLVGVSKTTGCPPGWSFAGDPSNARLAQQSELAVASSPTKRFPELTDSLVPSSPEHLRTEARAALKATKSSNYRGVHWNVKSGSWYATIAKQRITTQLGAFDDEERAALAYDKAALKQQGARARLNFHPDTEEWMGGMTLAEFKRARRQALTPQPTSRRWGGRVRERKPQRRRPNRLGYTGIARKRDRFVARVTHEGQCHPLGTWSSARDAALAYDRAVMHFGMMVRLNFPIRSRRLGAASPDELRAQARRPR